MRRPVNFLAALCLLLSWGTVHAGPFAPEFFYNLEVNGVSAPVLDSSGRPHVAYLADNKVFHTYLDAGSWITEEATTSGFSGLDRLSKSRIALALNASDEPHIAFLDPGFNVFHVSKSGGIWSKDLIASPVVGLHTHAVDLKVASTGDVHVIYDDGANGLRYAEKTGGSWTLSTVDANGFNGALVLDSADDLHLGYQTIDGVLVILNYATLSGVWTSEPVDSGLSVSQPLGTAISLQGSIPHLLWGANDVSFPNEPIYAVKSGGVWTKELVENGRGGDWPSIDVDGSGDVHVTYMRLQEFGDPLSPFGFRYAKKSGGIWTACYVDSGAVGTNGGVVTDGSDTPHVSYDGEDAGYYATIGVPSPPPPSLGLVTELVAGTISDAGAASSMTVDASGAPHTVFLEDSDFVYATNPAGDWIFEFLNIGWSVTSAPAKNAIGSGIVLDGDGDPHFLFINANSLWLAERELGSWTRTLVDQNVQKDKAALAIDASGNDIIVYNKIWSASLYHAERSGGSFTITLVDSVEGSSSLADTTANASVAVDAFGVTHVCYYRWTGTGFGELKYASGTNGATLATGTEVVLDGVFHGHGHYGSSITVQADGTPQIAYTDNRIAYHGLRLGPGQWQTSVIEAVLGRSRHPSIALDSQDKPVVAYAKRGGLGASGLVVARLDSFSGVWTSELVLEISPDLATIALDANDDIHVTCYDDTAGDFFYATNAPMSLPASPLVLNTSTETLAGGSGAAAGKSSDFALDASGAPHVVFVDSSDMGVVELKYGTQPAPKTGAAWSFETIPTSGNIAGRPTPLALDALGNPHAAFEGAGDLTVSRKKAGSWTSTIVNTGGTLAFPETYDMAVNVSGNEIILYRGTGALFLDETDTSGTVSTQGFGEYWAARHPAIVVDTGDIAHYSFVDTKTSPPSLVYGYGPASDFGDEPSLFTNNLIGWAGDGSHAWTSIALDSNGDPHIAYQRLDGRLGHADKTSGSWKHTIVDESFDETRFARIAIGSDDLPRISYYTLHTNDGEGLKLAKRESADGLWATTFVDSGASVGLYGALAIDGSDQVHLTYAIGATGEFLYTVEDLVTSVDGETFNAEVPAVTRLVGNAPDPFNPATTIRYQLGRPGRVELAVYDVAGRLVRTLVRPAMQPAGRHEVIWQGRSDHGTPVGSGVYFARLRAGKNVQVDRMVLIR